jgi:hypothetical protein
MGWNRINSDWTMQVTRTPADVLATFSRRYREHYGDRLVGIFAVPEFPFSDEGPGDGGDDDGRAIEVVVILQEPYDPFEETDPVVDIAMDVTEEYDWWMGIFARHAARGDDLADWARERGVEL